MKLVTLSLAVVLLLVGLVGAAPAWETNAQRLARGLPPKAPMKRFSASEPARRGSPSGTPSQCSTGHLLCCNSLTKANDSVASLILGLLDIHGVDPQASVGLTCSPLSVSEVGVSSCSSVPVCCENNSFNGLIALNCVPVNLNL